jgi:hypothetical protein
MYRSIPAEQPAIYHGRLIGRIDGCTNPESAELLPDGQTFVFGNCTLMVGHPAYRQGKGIVYIKGAAFVSKARIASRTEVVLEKRELITGLTATLGCDILPRATKRFPAGTAFINEGANPITERGGTHIADRARTKPRIVAFDPVRGEVLGEIPLDVESDFAKHRNGIDQPNGLAITPGGDIIVGDIPNGNPVSQLPPPVPAAIYRIPHAAIDDIAERTEGGARSVQRVETPGFINGLTASKQDGSCWAVSCSSHDPVKGGLYRIEDNDFVTGRQPTATVAGLGILDGVGVTRRGTLLASTPLTGEIHAFGQDGSHQVIRIEGGEKTVRMPADFNVCYPNALSGEPALLVTDISVGRVPGDASVAVVDISGL